MIHPYWLLFGKAMESLGVVLGLCYPVLLAYRIFRRDTKRLELITYMLLGGSMVPLGLSFGINLAAKLGWEALGTGVGASFMIFSGLYFGFDGLFKYGRQRHRPDFDKSDEDKKPAASQASNQTPADLPVPPWGDHMPPEGGWSPGEGADKPTGDTGTGTNSGGSCCGGEHKPADQTSGNAAPAGDEKALPNRDTKPDADGKSPEDPKTLTRRDAPPDDIIFIKGPQPPRRDEDDPPDGHLMS